MAERSKYEHGIPAGDLQDLAGALARLLRAPEWQAFKELAQGVRVVTRENLESCEAQDIIHWRGYLKGIKDIVEEIPQSIVHDAEEQAARDAAKEPGAAAAARFFTERGSDGDTTF
jgi:hypothetical protein